MLEFFATKGWFLLALGAAMSWGVGYAMLGRLLHMGITTSFLMVTSGIVSTVVFGGLLLWRDWGANSKVIAQSGLWVVAAAFGLGLLYNLANVLILSSIQQKNATLASLVEISYPIFTVFFAWLFFREMHLNVGTTVGAALVLAGMVVIFTFGGE